MKRVAACVLVIGLALCIPASTLAYQTVRQFDQPESRDATGKVKVEAARITIVLCNGPGENGGQFYIYQYLKRPGINVIHPPDWSHPIGGPNIHSLGQAAQIACRKSPAVTKWSVTAFANNVRVLAPLVGKWQLGKFHLRGSGSLGKSGTATGTISDVDDLTSPPNRLFVNMNVIGGQLTQQGAALILTLTVQITNADHVNGESPNGLRGTVVLISDPTKLPNGKNSDGFTETWAGSCGHVHGTNNTDAGPRTSPQTGGPPNGGQWAIVRLTP
jgi:hypothetical protein